MKTSPAPSTATPYGRLHPLPTVTWAPPPAGTSTTWLLLVSAMKTSPAPSTATPYGRLHPLPTVTWAPPPAGTSTTWLWLVSAMKTSRNVIDIGQRAGQGLYDFWQAGDEFVVNRGLVVLLVGGGFHVHRPGFSVTLLKDDFGFRLALCANRAGMAFGFHCQPLPFGFGQCLDPFALNLGAL